jgi:hypothetical protein
VLMTDADTHEYDRKVGIARQSEKKISNSHSNLRQLIADHAPATISCGLKADYVAWMSRRTGCGNSAPNDTAFWFARIMIS